MLLALIIGKRSVFSNTPLLAEMAAVLREIEAIVDVSLQQPIFFNDMVSHTLLVSSFLSHRRRAPLQPRCSRRPG